LSKLVTTTVWDEITTAAKNTKQPSQVAVAYFGSKGPSLLPLLKGSALVVDASVPTVAQGATSPAALDQVRKGGVDIYTAQYLHAKVFAFDCVAFVGSANASQNSETKLIEAALKVTAKAEISAVRGFV
jgi:phosphatidylserine/phosphatidylglycerophosphate/cardiolipin synthase-like enzyme